MLLRLAVYMVLTLYLDGSQFLVVQSEVLEGVVGESAATEYRHMSQGVTAVHQFLSGGRQGREESQHCCATV